MDLRLALAAGTFVISASIAIALAVTMAQDAYDRRRARAQHQPARPRLAPYVTGTLSRYPASQPMARVGHPADRLHAIAANDPLAAAVINRMPINITVLAIQLGTDQHTTEARIAPYLNAGYLEAIDTRAGTILQPTDRTHHCLHAIEVAA